MTRSADAVLVRRLVTGDRQALDLLGEWVRGAISRYRQILGSDAEDIEQETILEILHALDTGRYRGESSLATWVQSCARFRAIDALRAAGRREEVPIEDRVLVSKLPDPLERAESQENLRLLAEVLARMSPECRELWEMIQDGMSYQQMSSRLGVRAPTLRVRVHRCRERALELRRVVLAKGM